MIRVRVTRIDSPSFQGWSHEGYVQSPSYNIGVTIDFEAGTMGELKMAKECATRLTEEKEFDFHDLVAFDYILRIPPYMRDEAFDLFDSFFQMSKAEQDVVKDFVIDLKSGRKKE